MRLGDEVSSPHHEVHDVKLHPLKTPVSRGYRLPSLLKKLLLLRHDLQTLLEGGDDDDGQLLKRNNVLNLS